MKSDALPGPTHMSSPLAIWLPPQRDTFVTTHGAAVTHQGSLSVLCILGFTDLCWQVSTVTCHRADSLPRAPRCSRAPCLPSPRPWPALAFSLSLQFHLPEYRKLRLMSYAASSDQLILLSNMHLCFLSVFHDSIAYFSRALSQSHCLDVPTER